MASVAVVTLAVASPAYAQTKTFDVQAQDAASGVASFARQADIQLLISARDASGKRTHAVKGNFSIEEGLRHLLKGTGLHAQATGAQTYTVVPIEDADLTDAEKSRSDNSDIVVTGSRIKGSPPTSPVIELSQRSIREAGQTNLGQVIRSIPQNFSGGQNPGVASGTQGSVSDQNLTGGSALNLRGLGPDATLTLLNGKRLAYDAFTQAIDISTIPIDALDRIEIVADGASAIYGSDAVGGVANVILKPDYDGVATSARLGQATDGGDFQQQYGIVAGKRWSDGGFIATYNFSRSTPIYADQRDYTDYLRQPYTLLGSNKTHALVVSGHQDIGSFATFSIDGLYSKRLSNSVTSTTAIGRTSLSSESYTVAPKIEFHLPQSWSLSISGLYGRDDTDSDTKAYAIATGAFLAGGVTCYCNSVKSVELNAEGPLFQLPGGQSRVALGGGYRENSFDQNNITRQIRTFGKRHSYYGFGELYLPVIGSDQNIPFVRSLSFTGAVRYEDYNDIGGIATPKIGAIYSPTEDFDFKGSWGKSFKAPTLAQEFSTTTVYLYPAAQYGTGFPSSATVLYALGGNKNLKPERATTWTATLSIHPRSVPGLRVEVSYFNVKYTNRVIQARLLGDLYNNPSLANLILRNPSVDLQNSFIDMAPAGIMNITGKPYDPANVAAIINGLYLNVSSQSVEGVDGNLSYRIDVGDGHITLGEQASYISSSQRTTPTSAPVTLAGTTFDPPHFRSRSSLSWDRGGLVLSAFLNYLGGVTDPTLTPPVKGDSMTTVDLAAVYSLKSGHGIFSNIDLSLSVENLLNQRPPYLKNSQAFYVNYDSTNYSAIGRLVSFSIAKRW